MSQTVTLSIPSITCNHCVMTIKRETRDLPGVISVEGDAEAKTATFVLEDERSLRHVKDTLAEIGYHVQG
jgi:copper chaperone